MFTVLTRLARRARREVEKFTLTVHEDGAHPPSEASKHRRDGGKPHQLCRRYISSLFLFLGIIIALVLVVRCAVSPSVKAPPRAPRVWGTRADPQPIGTVRSLDELRSFCHAKVPELETASWVKKNLSYIGVRQRYGERRSPIEAAPVCISYYGTVLVDHVVLDNNQSRLKGFVEYPLHRLTDDSFKVNGTQGFAEAVPALAFITHGQWIDTHIWHLIRDCLGSLMMLFLKYENEELFSMPTQTVFLRGGVLAWLDRYGLVKQMMGLSARVLNAFSSPRRGGPFFPTSPVFLLKPQKANVKEASTVALADMLSRPLMQCYCQAVGLRSELLRKVPPHDLYDGLQDMVARQFNEDDYLTGYSFEETDRRRRASHPWASQFWNESTFDVNGTYRPRALFIHRKSRLIGNVEKYIAYLKQLDFRVEEIFPERLTLDQQYHLGRYADLLVGMHGLGISHAYWMDRFPRGCRSIVEFRPWVYHGLPIDLHRILSTFMEFDYHHPWPIDVTFGSSVKNKTNAKFRLMLKRNMYDAYKMPEFTDQIPFYNEAEVLDTFDSIRRHLNVCLRRNEHVRRHSYIVD